ncbi:hypothetical protein [Parvularcula dongshanensis]|uniref:Cell division septal protein FtsQ n=1 Tax=Parvularcula dongshanensis TaxID=1173995 RepID=A0A840I6F5_9PROT|nr:hypothetical protein [Parvularcula dongshanensis]MBB4659590.1 cell division septal protein FtsQ [Parvularcula dongshanensis]
MTALVDTSERSNLGEDAMEGEKARQGKVILRRRWQRIVFVGGLAAIVLVVILLRLT